jgi:hypothetical protein
MRSLFIIQFLFFLLPGCLNVRKVVKEYDPKKNHAATRNSDDIIICEFPIEARVNKEEWTAYLNKNLVLNDASLDTIPTGTYTVFVQFTIDKKGRIGDVMILRDPGYGLGRRVANVVLKFKDKWEPAEQNGQFIKSYRRQPITFIVEEEKEGCENEIPTGLML